VRHVKEDGDRGWRHREACWRGRDGRHPDSVVHRQQDARQRAAL